jgi:hypothetical protein
MILLDHFMGRGKYLAMRLAGYFLCRIIVISVPLLTLAVEVFNEFNPEH